MSNGFILRFGAVEGAQDSTRRKSLRDVQTFRSLLLRRESSCNDNEAPNSCAPSTTVRSLRELQWSPSPASRGRMVRAIPFSRRSPRPSFARPLRKERHCTDSLTEQTGDPSSFVRKGRRNADSTPRIRCPPHALRARPRVQRDALAFRRSTAALASAMCRGSIQAALHATQCAGVTCVLGVALKRSTSRAGHNAGGVDARTARERQ